MVMKTDRQGRTLEYQLVAIAVGCAMFAVFAITLFPDALAGGPPGIPVQTILEALAGTLMALAALVAAGAWLHHRWYFSAMQRLRRDLGDPAGWLDHHDLSETSGAEAVVAEARTFWRRPGPMAVEESGWVIGELISGRWTVRSQRMRAAYPRSVCVVGPQGSRKSWFLVPMILDAPGPAVVTSTKDELIATTARFRAEHHGPVYVFDPLNMTGGLHNFPFDPVWNCARLTSDGAPDSDYADAIASAMIRGAAITKRMNEEFWADAGREILRCYLVAADLIGAGSQKVQEWAHEPDAPEPIKILTGQPDRVPPGWLSLLRQRLATNPRMRDGYFATVASCTDYLGHAGAVDAIRRPGTDIRDDIGRFLDSRATVYVVGDKSKRGMASMMTALAESLVYRAREHAKSSGGRLTEPLSMFLDEVANLTPVDLPNWAAETRGWGIMTVAVIQSRAQLDKVWGADDAKIIWDNLVTKVILGSLGDERFLEGLSRLGGERRVPVASENTRGGASSTNRLERVIALHVIRSLPPNHAFVLGAARHPAVVRFEPGYERLERIRTGQPWSPTWPRWWRHPVRAAACALELGRHR